MSVIVTDHQTETPVELQNSTSPNDLRDVFAAFPSGVVSLAAYANGQREGLAASTFTVGVSLDPPLVAFAVQNSSRTWPRLRQAERIGVSVLADDQDKITRQLAAKEGDRFAGIDLSVTESGAIFVDRCALWLETSVYAELPAGDHHMVLLEVHGVTSPSHREPLVFHRSQFRNLKTAEGNE